MTQAMIRSSRSETTRARALRCALGHAKLNLEMAVLFLGCLVLSLMTGCASPLPGDGSATNSSQSTLSSTDGSLSITPSLQTLTYGAKVQFTGTGGNGSYSYFIASGSGTIDAGSGLYVAGSGNDNVSIGVSSGDLKAYATVIVTAPSTAVTQAGASSKIFKGSYAVLVKQNSGCVASKPYSDACNFAIDATCKAAGYGTGYGPVEHSGDLIYYVCIVTGVATQKAVSYSTLTSLHPDCNANVPMSSACAAAMNRYCKSQKFVSGFGPSSHDGTNATVNCMGAAGNGSLVVSFADLGNQVSACTEDNSASDACMAATNRYCGSKKFVSGYGVYEHANGTAYIGCTM